MQSPARQSEQLIDRQATAARATAAGALVLFDSWTANGRVRASSRGSKATRELPNVPALFRRNLNALRRLDLGWLTAETHWLDGDRTVIVEAPQTRHDLCSFRNPAHPAHEAAARQEPQRHGRLDGSVSLTRTAPQVLVATVRLAGHLRGAATVQWRQNPRPTRRKPRTAVRLLAYLGTRDDLALGLDSLRNFLASRDYVEQALNRAARGDRHFHASLDARRMEGRRTSVLDTLDGAGAPGSPERRFWAPSLDGQTSVLTLQPGWAQRPLQPLRQPALKAR